MTQGESQVNLEHDEGLILDKVEGFKLLTIREFANVCRTTPRTLRFYEQKGLFKPVRIDPSNKYRNYDSKQAREFLKIKLLQNFHLPLKQIVGYLSLRGEKNERRSNLNAYGIASLSRLSRLARNDKTRKSYSAEDFLDEKLKGLKEEIREKEKEYKFLQKIRAFLFHNERDSGRASLARMTNSQSIFQTKTFGPFSLFCMKVEHGEYAKISEYIKTLWKEAKRLNLKCELSEITFYLDSRYNPKNTPLEIALVLKSTSKESKRRLLRHLRGDATPRCTNNLTMKQLSNNFYFKSYPKTKALVYEYTGPYEYLILIYQKLFEYIRDQKIKPEGLVFEKYNYGPLNAKSKYDYQTMIGFPIFL